MTARSSIRITCNVRLSDSDLGEEESIVVFRTVQEALTNIERHAEASHVRIRLSSGKGELVLCIGR